MRPLRQAENDRVGLLHTLATLEEHPESVPINALVPVDGTPLADEGKADAPDIWDMGRMIATARVVMPRTMVRLSAGRLSFSEAEQVKGNAFDKHLYRCPFAALHHVTRIGKYCAKKNSVSIYGVCCGGRMLR